MLGNMRDADPHRHGVQPGGHRRAEGGAVPVEDRGPGLLGRWGQGTGAGHTEVEVEDMKRVGLVTCVLVLWTSFVLMGQQPNPGAQDPATAVRQGSSDQDAIWIVGR
ncbi:MAG: hypothetical protein O7G29_13555 [Acidobacteria bacterium]|nr:hypothetical protein [Acidobacteriota bacterium]